MERDIYNINVYLFMCKWIDIYMNILFLKFLKFNLNKVRYVVLQLIYNMSYIGFVEF